MSRILVVEPHRMLQQALVVALFPEHQGQVFARIPEGEVLAAADLLIIDAAALKALGALPTREVRAVQSCHVPVVWIDAETPPDTAAFTKLVRLAPPLKRDDLRAAAVECLRLSSAAEPFAAPKPARAVAAKTKTIEPKPESAARDNDKEFIDLVDVFEEATERGEARAEARNKD
jgi:hypothetical protein